MVVEQDEQDIAGLTKLPDLAALSQDKPPVPAPAPGSAILDAKNVSIRSEERRVGKECVP